MVARDVLAHVFKPTTARVDLLVLLPPSKNRPRNALLDPTFLPDATELGTASHLGNYSSMGSEDKETLRMHKDKKLLRKLLFSDLRCFVTGSPQYVAQAAHMLNPLRSPPKGKDRVYLEGVKEALERLLTLLYFNGGHPFTLDGRCNLMLLSTELHSALDLYGAVLVTLSTELARCNADWDNRYVEDRTAARDLNMTSETSIFNIATLSWEPWTHLSVISPFSNNPLLTGSVTPPQLHDGLPILASPTGPLRLQFKTLRKPNDILSLFAVLVNSASKIHAFVSDENSEVSAGMNRLDGWMQLLMGHIYHVPNKHTYREPLTAALGVPSSHAIDSDSPLTPTTPTPFLNDMDIDTPATPTSRDRPQELEAQPEDVNSGPPTPPEPDIVPGINLREYEQLLGSLSDPNQTMETPDIFAMLLWGAQGRPQFRRPPTNPLLSGTAEEDQEDSEDESDSSDEEW
ncbi:hypothetical protein C8F01DRAFT_1374885 [Mycena amicta]|nr:hypothetical protein C8F01DRAFT_1374885 [Mycena amicta]